MLVQALEEMRIPVGAEVEIETASSDNDKKRRKITGTVTHCARRHFTVQGAMYSETFLKADLAMGLIRLKSKIQPAVSRALGGEEILSVALLQSVADQTSGKKEAI